MAVRRPRNVLILWTDQQRPDTIGAYRGASRDASAGYSCQTPAVDRLAAESVVFERAYCTQPSCAPSRASVLTGLCPHTHGAVSHGGIAGFVPPPTAPPTLADVARSAGYACGMVGVSGASRGFEDWGVSRPVPGMDTPGPHGSHAGAAPTTAYEQFLRAHGCPLPEGKTVQSHAYVQRLPEGLGRPTFHASEAIRFLETHWDRPFVLSMNFREAHPPYTGPFDSLYDRALVPLPRSWYELWHRQRAVGATRSLATPDQRLSHAAGPRNRGPIRNRGALDAHRQQQSTDRLARGGAVPI